MAHGLSCRSLGGDRSHCECQSVSCLCKFAISSGWLHARSIALISCEYWSFLATTCCVNSRYSSISSLLMQVMSSSTNQLIITWSDTTMSAAWSSCHLDIPVKHAYVLVTAMLTNIVRSECQRMDHTLQNNCGFCFCWHCWLVSFCQVHIDTVVSFAPTVGLQIIVKPTVGSAILSSTGSKQKIVHLRASSVSGSYCPVQVPRIENV